MELRSSHAMKLYTALLLVAILMTTYSSAIPKPDEKKRVHEKALSDKDHEEGGEHNADYDHDAFLGKEDAQTFDQLSPEESRERLGKIVDKIDKDGDGQVTEEELKEWIQYVQRRYVVADTDRMWKEHQVDPDDRLSWESYKKRTYGHSDDHNAEDSPLAQYKETIDRDERRWKMADKDSDMRLTKDEFMAFLHPEEAEHMRDIVVQETLEDIDKDKDGFINMEEYIADIWDEDEDEDEDDEDEDHHDGEPDWVQSEREQFKSYRDKDGDGRLNKDEIMDWIIPQDYDHSTAEAGHLMNSADNNKDRKLTKEEILDKYDVFVGSQATDFGEALMKHDEF